MNERESQQRNKDTGRSTEVVSVSEVINKSPHKWVLMKVTETNESGWPIRGQVLACMRSRKQLSQFYIEEAKNPSPEYLSNAPYYLFKAVPLCANSDEWRAVVTKLENESDLDAK